MSKSKTLKEIALELLEKYRISEETGIYECSGFIKADLASLENECGEIRKQIEESVEPSASEWIPVTERLPEENVRVLVTRKSNIFVRDDYIDIGRYTKQKRWETEEYVNVDVKAWMPLPDPYKGGDAE